jgi:hypothetical protein
MATIPVQKMGDPSQFVRAHGTVSFHVQRVLA